MFVIAILENRLSVRPAVQPPGNILATCAEEAFLFYGVGLILRAKLTQRTHYLRSTTRTCLPLLVPSLLH